MKGSFMLSIDDPVSAYIPEFSDPEVLEVASGIRFNRFLEQGIFDSLGMYDIRFILNREQQHRLVPLYRNPA